VGYKSSTAILLHHLKAKSMKKLLAKFRKKPQPTEYEQLMLRLALLSVA
jgi:hypothetical protein